MLPIYLKKSDQAEPLIHPFRVEIINAHYDDLMPPLIEAEFSGTLYRKDNPNDSIVVKGKFSHTLW